MTERLEYKNVGFDDIPFQYGARGFHKFIPAKYIPDWRKLRRNAYNNAYQSVKRGWFAYAKEHGLQANIDEFQPRIRELAKLEYVRWLARNDLYWLSTELLGCSDFDYLHWLLACWLYMTRNEEYRGVILPRDTFKTTEVDINHNVQNLLQDFGLCTAILCPSEKFGKIKISQMMRRHLTSKKLVNLFPHHLRLKKTAYEVWTDLFFSVVKPDNDPRDGANFEIITVDGKATGHHFDVGCYDDIVHEENYEEEEQRQKAKDNAEFMEFKISPVHKRRPIKSRIIACDTIYHQDDYMCDVLIPRLCGSEEELDKFMNSETGYVSDKLFMLPAFTVERGRKYFIFPERLGPERVKHLEETSSPDKFATQVMCRVMASSDKMFPPPYESRYWNEIPSPHINLIGVDPAGEKEKEGNDKSVIKCAAVDGREALYEKDNETGNWRIYDLCQRICDMAERNAPITACFIEQTGMTDYVGHLEDVMKERDIYFDVYALTRPGSSGSKKKWIKILQPYWDTNRIFFDRRNAECLKQIRTFPGKFDDEPDGFAHIVHGMKKHGIQPPEFDHSDTPQIEDDGNNIPVPTRTARVDNFRNKVAKANMPELDYSFLEESDGEI